MASSNFTFDDAIQAARRQLNDDAQRRWTDADILAIYLPRVYAQLAADRPDLFVGTGGVTFKPAQMDPIPFDDAGYNPFVEALVAAIMETQEESVSMGQAVGADQRSERARRS